MHRVVYQIQVQNRSDFVPNLVRVDPKLVKERLLVSKLVEPPPMSGLAYIGPKEVDATTKPMSNNMKGTSELGSNNSMGTRHYWRFGLATVGFPVGH